MLKIIFQNLKKFISSKNFNVIKDLKFIEGVASGNLILDELQNNQYKTVFDGELSDVTININDKLPFIKKINGKINYSKKEYYFLNYLEILENLI